MALLGRAVSAVSQAVADRYVPNRENRKYISRAVTLCEHPLIVKRVGYNCDSGTKRPGFHDQQWITTINPLLNY